MPTILIARHAQASFGGEDYDVLSTLGESQAAALAADLARRAIRVDRVVSGSLVRQRRTAEAVAHTAARPVDVDPRWDEYATDEILTDYSTTAARPSRPAGSDAPTVTPREFQDLLEAALLRWIEAGEHARTAETWPAFQRRVGSAVDDVAARLASGQTALVCTSAGVLAAICVRLLGVDASAFLALNRVAVNAGVTKVVHGRAGSTLVGFNDHAHLESGDRSLLTYR